MVVPLYGFGCLVAFVFLGTCWARDKKRLTRARMIIARLQAESAGYQETMQDALKKRDLTLERNSYLEAQASAFQARYDERERNIEATQARIDETLSLQTAKLFDQAQESFLHEAQKTFAHQQELESQKDQAREKAMNALITPLHENLLRYEKNLQTLKAEQCEARGAISTQIRELAVASQSVREEAQKLTTALRSGPKTRGRWGEEQLRNVVELAGMSAHVDFLEQKTIQYEGRRLQPDMLVRLPDQKFIVIDSKVSLTAYLDAMEAKNDRDYHALIAKHTDHIRKHITDLASRDYAAAITGQSRENLDFVILFLPAESFYAEAIHHRPALFQEAFEKKVLIATPTTLIAILKAISLGWRKENASRNAEEIAELATDLFSSLQSMRDYIDGLGQSLEMSVKKYTMLGANFERRVLPRANKLTNYEMPGIEHEIKGPRSLIGNCGEC